MAVPPLRFLTVWLFCRKKIDHAEYANSTKIVNTTCNQKEYKLSYKTYNYATTRVKCFKATTDELDITKVDLDLVYVGPSMFSGLTHSSNCSAVRKPSLRAASFSVVPSWWAVLAKTAALSYPMWGLRAVTSINDSLSSFSITALLALIPITQLFVKDRLASPSRRTDCSTLLTIIGLKQLSSKWPLLVPTVTATWFPITCAATMVIASHWVGFTLPVNNNILYNGWCISAANLYECVWPKQIRNKWTHNIILSTEKSQRRNK